MTFSFRKLRWSLEPTRLAGVYFVNRDLMLDSFNSQTCLKGAILALLVLLILVFKLRLKPYLADF